MRLHRRRVGLLAQKALHRLVHAGQGAQLQVVIGVGQHAHVEHIVGIDRDAVLEAERLEHQRHLVGGRLDQGLDVALQLRATDVAGVDHMGVLAQVAQQLALLLNDLHQGLAAVGQLGLGQWVAAPGFGETAHQGAGGGVQEQHVQVHARGLEALQLLQLARQIGQARGTAGVDGDCHAVAMVYVLQAHKVGQQLGRQVVHAVVARVFQGVECDRLAGTRHAGDQHNFQIRHSLPLRDRGVRGCGQPAAASRGRGPWWCRRSSPRPACAQFRARAAWHRWA